MKRIKSLTDYSHSEPIFETDVKGNCRRTGSRHVSGNGRHLGEPTYYKKTILALVLLSAGLLASCTRYDPSAEQPQGGRLPLDRGGDANIGWVSGTKQAPTFTGEARPAIGAVKVH